MPDIPKHIKLFHNAGIDYITSFIKLWLSFNSWYKKEYEHQTVSVEKEDGTTEEKQITNDAFAIKKCKQDQKIRGIFFSLLSSTNPEEIKRFHEPIKNLLRLKIGYEIKNNKSQDVFNYYEQSEIRFSDFQPRIDFGTYEKINDDLYVENEHKDKLIEATLDIIYGLRCSLFHGDFDINDKIFEKMIFNAHSILHILLERVIF